MINKNKILETSLVLTVGFLVLYFIFKSQAFIYVAFAFGIIGIFIPALARYITIAWFKLADALNFVVSKIILGTIFIIVLVPVSFFYKKLGKEKLNIKKTDRSSWHFRDKKYDKNDLENVW